MAIVIMNYSLKLKLNEKAHDEIHNEKHEIISNFVIKQLPSLISNLHSMNEWAIGLIFIFQFVFFLILSGNST